MEKLVQVAVRIPLPEPFLLRRILLAGLTEFTSTNSEGEELRLSAVIDQFGYRLDTLRLVKRVLDAVRFTWPVLEGRVDLADYLWLQITRTTMPELFNWVEDYLSGMAVQASGRASVTKEGRAQSYARLQKALDAANTSFEHQASFLSTILPGLQPYVESQANKLPIYLHQGAESIALAARDRRLASPDHQRLYFALATPTGSVEEADYGLFWQAVDEGAGPGTKVLNALFETGDGLEPDS